MLLLLADAADAASAAADVVACCCCSRVWHATRSKEPRCAAEPADASVDDQSAATCVRLVESVERHFETDASRKI